MNFENYLFQICEMNRRREEFELLSIDPLRIVMEQIPIVHCLGVHQI